MTQSPPGSLVALPERWEGIERGSVICCRMVAEWALGLIEMSSARIRLAGTARLPLSCTVIVPSGRSRAKCWPEKFVGYLDLVNFRLCGVAEPPSFQVIAPVAISTR